MNYNKAFPNLGYILGYFHQRWSSLYDWQGNTINFESVIRYAKTENGLNRTNFAIEECKKNYKSFFR